jgi:hypothetical protein
MRLIFVFILLVLSEGVVGQTFSTLDNLSPKVKYSQINTAHFRVIYPKGFTEQGQRMANTLEHLYAPVSKTLGREPLKRTPIILQSRNSVANGFVTLGPRRSEFYTTTPQNANLLGNNDWLDLLAIHEFRHVVQYDRSRTGFTGFIYYLLGEFTQNAVASGTVPSWFWEGDAVNIETALTSSGRGRIPEFSQAFRANLLELGDFNYSKQYLRSYKDFIPNHYVLGYHFNNYMRSEYGAKAVEDMVDKTWRQPYIPFSHSFSVQKQSGEKMPVVYQDMMDELQARWSSELSKEQFTSFTTINTKRRKVYTNYSYPQFLDNGDILAIKSGLGDIQQFVVLDPSTGKEKKVFVPGPVNDAGMLSVQGATAVWNEFQYDARWRANSYSVIKQFNVATKKASTLTSKTRYGSASLSPNRSLIATIELPDDYSCHLVILNAFTGEVVKKVTADAGSFFSTPSWDEKGENLVLLEAQDGLKSLQLFNLNTETFRTLLPFSTEHLATPIIKNNKVYYTSARTGIDNIYVLDISDNRRFRITSSRYGARNAAISRDNLFLLYNDYSVLGNDVAVMALDSSQWEPIEEVRVTHQPIYTELNEQEGNPTILSDVPDSTYHESRYRKKFLNVHSWGPFFTGDVNSLQVGVYSANVLSTTDLFLGYEFDDQGNGKGVLQLSYQGLYPILDLITTYGFRQENFPYTDTLDVRQTDIHKWNELTVKGGPRIPWVLTNSKFQTSLEVHNYVGWTGVTNYSSTRLGEGRYFGTLNNGNLIQNEFELLLTNFLKRSKRDVNSRWGQLLLFENYSTPYGGDYNAGLTALRGQFYFPGIGKHHSLNFLAGVQHRKITLDQDEYWFSNRMPFPRGYGSRTFENFYTVRSNYELPLLYPDLRLGPWLYFQRIKTNFFYDFGYGITDVVNQEVGLQFQEDDLYQSFGIDLIFDFNLMRALPILELGVRYVYIPEQNSSQFEFLIGNIGF